MKADNPAQSAAFIAKVKELESDGDESATDKLMGHMAMMKPEPRKKKAPATSKKAPGRKTGARSPN